MNTYHYDIILISETWLEETDLSSNIINTQHHTIIRNDRRTRAGGVAAIYRKEHTNKVVSHTVNADELCGFELLVFDFYTTSRCYERFICVYLPPQGSNDLSTVKSLIRVLRRFMTEQVVHIVGDFNFSDYKTYISHTTTPKEPLKQFLYFLEEHHLKQLITKPTHKSNNILDLVITSKPQNMTAIKIHNPLTDTCDHNMIEMRLNINTTHKSIVPPKQNFYAANYTDINQYLSSIC